MTERVIYKYPVPYGVGPQERITLPHGAEVLAVQMQSGKPMVWAIADPNAPLELRDLRFFGTGHRLPPPMAVDLGYHSPRPMYEGQSATGHCDLLGCECFYDGSSLNAEPVMDILRREGSDGVWRALERYYRRTFEAARAEVSP